MAKLTDTELTALLKNRYEAADSASSHVQRQRIDAQKRYNCEPYGDEQPGLSKFVDSTVRDTIEWVLPQIVEPFANDENAIEFTALSPEDVSRAALETAYVRHVIFYQNPGFLEMYQWAKDGLLFKNGVVKSWWDKKIVEKKEEYEDKDYASFLRLMNDEAFEVKAVTVHIDGLELSQEEAFATYTAVDLLAAKFDVSGVRTSDHSQIKIKAIPPENVKVMANWNSLSLDDCPYYCHEDETTAGELLEQGYERALIDTIPETTGNSDTETALRMQPDGGMIGEVSGDWSSRKIKTFEHYIVADLGDGKVQRYCITCGGENGDVVLNTEPYNEDSSAFSVWTPVINSHKHYGLSVHDLADGVALLKTNLWRQMLNNLYLVNHPAKLIVEDAVNKEDLLRVGPGVNWRVKNKDAISVFTTPFVGEATIPVLSLADEMRRERTGVSGSSQSLDLKALADSTNIVGPMLMSQDLMRVKMMIRVFAETGFKHLMRRVHELGRMHDSEQMIPSAGGFQSVNPQEWNSRDKFTIKVGVGYVEKIQRMQGINSILTNQKEIAGAAGLDSPLLNADGMYSALVEQAKLLGYADGAKFYRDPKTYTPPEPKPDPVSEAVQVEEARTVADLQKQAVQNKITLKKHEDEMKLKAAQLAADTKFKYDQLDQDRDLRREEMILRYSAQAGRGNRASAASPVPQPDNNESLA